MEHKGEKAISRAKAEICEKNISLFESIGKIMGKKTVKEKAKIEQQFDNVRSKIAGWENDRKAGSQIGPWILLLLGALVTTLGFFSGIFSSRVILGSIIGIAGFLIIIAAWIWSKRRSKNEKNIEDKILNLKSELSRL